MLHFKTYMAPSPHSEWVTFVHGAGGSSSIWYKQIKDFKQHFNILLIDLRGHGQSKSPIYEKIKKYTFKSIGDDIIEVLDYLKVSKSHFIGISLGTILIRELGERFPERVSAMVLGGAVMKLNLRGQVLMRFGALVQSILPYMLLYKLFAFIIMPRKHHKESRLLFVSQAKKLYQKEFKRWYTLISEVNPLLTLFREKDSGIPTLYVMGQEDYMFLPSIQKLVSGHRSSTLEVIPGCGHVVNVEQPSIFNHIVLKYLSSGK